MDRFVLRGYLDAGLSLDGIAEQVGKHPSTVSYWLKKHGLTANGAAKHTPKGGLRREALEPWVSQGLSTREIAGRLNRSQHTVRYWIDRYGLAGSHAARLAERRAALAAGRKTITAICRVHGSTTFLIENSGRSRCRQCRQDAVSRRRRKAKAQLVEEAGGHCAICGYDKYLGALQFHHLDPSQKEFGLGLSGATRSMERARREAAKCALLCANCHAEVEAGVAHVP